jgi:hypothetical protein
LMQPFFLIKVPLSLALTCLYSPPTMAV